MPTSSTKSASAEEMPRRGVKLSATNRSKAYRRSCSRSEWKPAVTRKIDMAARCARCTKDYVMSGFSRSVRGWPGTTKTISTSRRRRIDSCIGTRKRVPKRGVSGYGKKRIQCRPGTSGAHKRLIGAFPGNFWKLSRVPFAMSTDGGPAFTTPVDLVPGVPSLLEGLDKQGIEPKYLWPSGISRAAVERLRENGDRCKSFGRAHRMN